QQRAEDARRVKARGAEPIDCAVGADECRSLQVADETVVGDQWVIRHRCLILTLPSGRGADMTMLCQLPCLWPHPQGVIAAALVVERCSGDSKCTGRTGIDQYATRTRSPSPRPVHL